MSTYHRDLAAAVTKVVARAMPTATRAKVDAVAFQIAGAYELVGGELRPGPNGALLGGAWRVARPVAELIAREYANRVGLSPAEKTLAEFQALGIDPLDDGDPNGSDVAFDEIEAHMRKTGMLPTHDDGGGEAA
jgi:hypothetical protein